MAVEVAPGPTDATMLLLSGTGIERALAGVRTEFTIQSRDTFGNLKQDSADVYDVAIESESRGRLGGDVSDLGGGKYAARYTATQSGEYNVRVSLGVEASRVVGRLRVDAGEAYGPMCEGVGFAFEGGGAGESLEGVVVLRDVYGNA
eukprot:3472696-Rhodomonas_salina.1